MKEKLQARLSAFKLKMFALYGKCKSACQQLKPCILQAKQETGRAVAGIKKKIQSDTKYLPVIKEKINRFIIYVKNRTTFRLWGGLLGIAWLVIFITVSLVQDKSDKQVSAEASFELNTQAVIDDAIDRLNTLQSDLDVLSNTVASSDAQQDKLTHNIERVHEEMNALKQGGALEGQDDLRQELLALMAQLEALKSQDARMLPDTALPFQVLSLDFWNGIPLAAIKMGPHSDLMGLGETRAGWQLKEMDVQKGRLTFVNAQEERVEVSF